MIRRWPATLEEAALCWPSAWRLRTYPAWVLVQLLRRTGGITRQALWDTLYADRADGGPELRIIQVYVSQIRCQLKPWFPELGPGLGIEAQLNAGYRVSPQTRTTLLAHYLEPDV